MGRFGLPEWASWYSEHRTWPVACAPKPDPSSQNAPLLIRIPNLFLAQPPPSVSVIKTNVTQQS